MGSRSEPVLVSRVLPGRLFHFVMIKPTHYDDDGYPIQWLRLAIPSNTLACLNGLAEDAHRRNVLGPDVEIACIPMTRPTGGSGRTGSSERSARRGARR